MDRLNAAFRALGSGEIDSASFNRIIAEIDKEIRGLNALSKLYDLRLKVEREIESARKRP